ncbi:MAG: C-terminal binding protein [Candidatus Latescibacterota bacterium]|nr:C-terminal binding protein [Candidatus Latescibacterota bacterium]
MIEDPVVVRLNAEMFPISEPERKLLDRFGLRPIEVEEARPERIIPHVRSADAVCVVSTQLSAPIIDSMERCQLISRLGNGTDKIDVTRATERGIIVSNVPDFSTHEMAEHVMAVILSLAREIPRMQRYMRAGAFAQARFESFALRRLTTRTLGLIGWGDSAKAVARCAQPFGLEVIATRRNLRQSSPEAEDLGVEMMELESLLTRADYVSLHLPLNEETRGLLNRSRLEMMKSGAVLVNASRGEIVDEDALADLLRSGQIRGAGVDTYGVIDIFAETELVPTHSLVTAENVIATPHVSGLSVEANLDVAVGSVQSLASVTRGHLPHPKQIVNPEVTPIVPLKAHDPKLFETTLGED